MARSNIYRNGRVHVCAVQCATCIFRPGNLMLLEPGRLKSMVKGAIENDSCIICHDTLREHTGSKEQACCRGFFDLHPTAPLQIAERLGLIEFVDLEKK